MMKSSSDKGRRLYVRSSITHVVFGGKIYGSTGSKVDTKKTVTIEVMPSDGGRARVQVTQKVPHKKTIVETWRTVKF